MKSSFERVHVDVEKQYAKNVPESQFDWESQIIEAIIEAHGWTAQEYNERSQEFLDVDQPEIMAL